MSDNLDPYRKWLGIPPQEQPPNHYRLLGIGVFEDDPDVIAYAADRQMSHIRKFQSGAQEQLAQQLLSELAKAKLCLLAPQQRAAYDNHLKFQLSEKSSTAAVVLSVPRPSKMVSSTAGQASQPLSVQSSVPFSRSPQAKPLAAATAIPLAVAKGAPVAVAQGVPVAVATPVASETDSPLGVRPRSATSTARRPRRKNSAVPIITALCCLAGLSLVVLVLAIAASSNMQDKYDSPVHATGNAVNPSLGSSDKNSRPTEQQPSSRDKPDVSRKEPLRKLEESKDGHQVSDGFSASPAPSPKPFKLPDGDPQRAKQFAETIAAAEASLARRNLVASAQQLATAEPLKSGTAEAERWSDSQEFHGRLTEFWKAVDRGAKRLQSGDDVGFGSAISTFISLNDDEITLLVMGNRITSPLRELRTSYVVALAQRGLNSGDSAGTLAIATFLAIDDRETSATYHGHAVEMFRKAQARSATSAALARRLKLKPSTSAGKPPRRGSPALPTDTNEFPEPDRPLPRPGGGAAG